MDYSNGTYSTSKCAYFCEDLIPNPQCYTMLDITLLSRCINQSVPNIWILNPPLYFGNGDMTISYYRWNVKYYVTFIWQYIYYDTCNYFFFYQKSFIKTFNIIWPSPDLVLFLTSLAVISFATFLVYLQVFRHSWRLTLPVKKSSHKRQYLGQFLGTTCNCDLYITKIVFVFQLAVFL